MGNNPSRAGTYGYDYDLAQRYPRSGTLSRSRTQRPQEFQSTRRRHRSEDYYPEEQAYRPQHAPQGLVPVFAPQPFLPGYAQPQYFQPPPPQMTFVQQPVPVTAPPPGFVYSQPQVAMQHGVQPALAQPTMRVPVVQAATMQMPEPVIPAQYQQQQTAAQPPVIPQMPPPPPPVQAPSMPSPVTFPEPQISNPTPRPHSRPTRLAPGQYGHQEHATSPYDDFYGLYPHNPIPVPPKNFFLDSPYRSILRNLKESGEVVDPFSKLQRTNSVPIGSFRSHSGSGGSRQGRRRGLLGVFGSRRRHDDDDDQAQQESAPVVGGVHAGMPTLQEMPDGTKALVYSIPPQMVQVAGAAPAPIVPVLTPMPMPEPAHSASPNPAVRTGTPAPLRPHALKIDRQNELSGLLHFSPHGVRYEHKRYPTAFHLLEAFKFMESRPDIAERIRKCTTPNDAAAIAADKQRHIRPDWEHVVLQMMDVALYHKFVQHPDLRALLMHTGTAELVYSELNDPFWGDGSLGEGANELGKALMRVRDRLRTEGLNT